MRTTYVLTILGLLAGCGGGGNGGGGGSGGGGGGGDSAAYHEGDTLPEFEFLGYRDGTGSWGTIRMSDYQDPDGSRGINALYISLGKVLCGACEQEAQHIPGWQMMYQSKGVKFASAFYSGASPGPNNDFPITQADIDQWITEFQVTYDIMADPSFQLSNDKEPSVAPIGYLVDPRTMKVVKYYNGAPGFLQGLDELLVKNGASAP
jgi:hypothetical protein